MFFIIAVIVSITAYIPFSASPEQAFLRLLRLTPCRPKAVLVSRATTIRWRWAWGEARWRCAPIGGRRTGTKLPRDCG